MGPGSPGTRAERPQGPPKAQPPTQVSIIPYPSYQSDLECEGRAQDAGNQRKSQAEAVYNQ